MIAFGILLLLAAAAVARFVFRPSEGSRIPGIEIPFLLYAAVLSIGGVFAVTGLSWSLWPAGLWLMAVGGVAATIGLVLWAWLMPDFVWGLMAFAVGSLVALVGPVGLGVAYLIQHVVIGWV